MMFNRESLCRCSTVWVFIIVLVLGAGCDDSKALPTILITSPSFGDGETIPERHTCDGSGVSPQLYFDGAPEETVQFVVIVDDYDSPDGLINHWLLWGIDASSPNIPPGINAGEQSAGFLQGTTTDGTVGYSPPCPADNADHKYHFRVFAIDDHLAVNPGASRAQLLAAIDGLAVGYGELIGMFKK